jgi:hypothetical protein
MREDQLPMLVKFDPDPDENLAHALMMEEVTVPSDALVDAYFATETATHLMPQVTLGQGGVAMHLSNFCPVPLAWAPSFLDSKRPFEALQMGRRLVASLTDAGHRARAAPLLDWIRAACTHLGPNGADQTKSLLDQKYEPTAPDARVVKWMKQKLAPYQQANVMPHISSPPMGTIGGPMPLGARATIMAKEKEYTALETSKIQAACGLTDAQWMSELPELYPRMLEEGRTTARE